MDGLETKDNANDLVPRDPADPIAREPLLPDPQAAPVLPGALLPAPSLADPSAPNDFLPSPAAFVRPSLRPALYGQQPATETARPRTLFSADLAEGEDALGVIRLLSPLADLAVRRGTETPLTIGLLGGPGVGKSFALGKLLAEVEAASAGDAPESDDVINPILTVKIDAAGLSEPSAVSLAGAVYDELARDFPEIARESAHAVRDAHVVAREAAEQLDSERRRLDTERQTLSEIESRRARLPEMILFEQAGSHVDSYARSIRARIESRLESFGLTGDPVKNYKSLVRDIAESGGASARAGVALRAFWAFKGQTRLLVAALIFVLIALGCGAVVDHQSTWLDSLHSNQAFVSTADWLQNHIGWFSTIAELAWIAAAGAILINLWRGIRFLQPLFRGVGLLETEVADRRRDLDSLFAHQMRRVDALFSDVELTARRAAEADRRAANAMATNGDVAEPSPFAAMTPESQAERFFIALARAIPQGRDRAEFASARLPHRVVIGLDNLDRLQAPQMKGLLDAARRLFAQKSFVTIIAADPQRLSAALNGDQAEASGALEQWIDIPLNIAATPREAAYAGFVGQLLGDERSGEVRAQAKPIDWAISTDEANVLKALAPLAGASPRAVKRFVNLYRIARIETPENRPVLAFMLALDQGAADVDRAMIEAALAGNDDVERALDLRHASPALASALAAVEAAHGRVTKGDARRAMATVKAYSLRD
jgi:hypothetical protein